MFHRGLFQRDSKERLGEAKPKKADIDREEMGSMVLNILWYQQEQGYKIQDTEQYWFSRD